MNPFLQTLVAGLGSLGFGVLFHIRGRKLALITVGGALSWAVYLAFGPVLPEEPIRYFLAAATITILGEIVARLEKTPTTTFLVPSIIPLIPGGALYYTMNYALNRKWADFAHQASYTLQLATALALGIIAVTTGVRLLNAAIHKFRKTKALR